MAFCRRYFQTYFLELKLAYFDLILLKCVIKYAIVHEYIIGSGNGLAPNNVSGSQ